MKALCPSCKKETEFKYEGEQEIHESIRNDPDIVKMFGSGKKSVSLYTCNECKSTYVKQSLG